ncbi:MAG TPA: hypothetical protein VGL42_07340 [Opitutaceae bacterium]|jgi:hypothetical protein
MSLGLDALNKLQRMRAEDAASRTAPVFRTSERPKSSVNGWLAAGIVISLGLAVVALFRTHGSAPVVVASAIGVPAPLRSAPPSLALPAAAPTATPVPVQPTYAAAPTPAPLASVAPAPRAAPAPSAHKIYHNPLIEAFIANGRLGGVDDGSSGQRAVVLFNERIFHVGDTVNIAYGLRLVDIQSNRITFQDARGVTYERALSAN